MPSAARQGKERSLQTLSQLFPCPAWPQSKGFPSRGSRGKAWSKDFLEGPLPCYGGGSVGCPSRPPHSPKSLCMTNHACTLAHRGGIDQPQAHFPLRQGHLTLLQPGYYQVPQPGLTPLQSSHDRPIGQTPQAKEHCPKAHQMQRPVA